MHQQLTLLACGAVLQACAAGGTGPDGSFERGVAPTATAPDGRHVGFVLAHGLAGSVDSFDPAIVAALQADGRASYQDLAQTTGLTYANARRPNPDGCRTHSRTCH